MEEKTSKKLGLERDPAANQLTEFKLRKVKINL